MSEYNKGWLHGFVVTLIAAIAGVVLAFFLSSCVVTIGGSTACIPVEPSGNPGDLGGEG